MLPKFSITSLLCLFLVTIVQAESREITHEDIKNAMLSMVHMLRENTERLERHEARDRQTSQQLQKSVVQLTKKFSSLDNIMAFFDKLEDRATGIEQAIAQRDERERIQIQKMTDTLEDLQSRLEGWATEIESKVVEGTSKALPTIPTPVDPSPDILARIEASEAKIADKLEKKLDELGTGLQAKIAKATNQTVVSNALAELKEIGKKIEDLAQAVGQLENAAAVTPTATSGAATEDLNVKIGLVQELLHNALDKIRDLPRISEVQTMHNETQMSLEEARHALQDAVVQGNEGIATRMSENREEARDSVTALRSDMANQAERTNQELRDLGKGQAVMVEMADHVLDTKKRLEHAYKIMREVSELVMVQGLNINHTLNSRFDGISNDIMDNQNGALANLTVKMEQEMNQVWRQINVMYQQMMESAKALDKLHEQNEAYVNGTTSTMDGMESKVGEITKRMSEVDTNLNYLLGRLSLVTQEFNQIKLGLGAALDNIKASFKEVQEKANDLSNPGPHPVPQNYNELDSPDDAEKPTPPST
ncbi:uncharacterized protein LOC106644383 [Copidosoma floridanum]|uniref:uncharacterized protein LOC106644383 n=1 Tax=Copidosoma floridanum TaxID=29053 RepID=UPI0006C9AA31|nr:uncharacterized protein LOC106644383 [Copidosoma floridanum]XP_014215327.1 uncharacterized protein LOC106644383 [Copidosoma floridanum]